MQKNDLLTGGYAVELHPIPEEEGGGFYACHPLLGRDACIGDGETPEEALQALAEIREVLIEDWKARGIPFPAPGEERSDYSGKFQVRLPKKLHQELAEKAEKQGVSLNLYVNHLLSQGVKEYWKATPCVSGAGLSNCPHFSRLVNEANKLAMRAARVQASRAHSTPVIQCIGPATASWAGRSGAPSAPEFL